MRNEKARRFLTNMRRKPGVAFELHFPRADPGALSLLRRMLAFDPAGRPTCEEALADPYFEGLSQLGREPSAQPVSKLAFDFERRKLTTAEVACCCCSCCCITCELTSMPNAVAQHSFMEHAAESCLRQDAVSKTLSRRSRAAADRHQDRNARAWRLMLART